jgi:HEAT repeat protein
MITLRRNKFSRPLQYFALGLLLAALFFAYSYKDNSYKASLSDYKQQLRDKAVERRKTAAFNLGNLAIDGIDSTSDLSSALQDENNNIVKLTIVDALGKGSIRSDDRISTLAKVLQKGDIHSRKQSLISLRQIGPPAVSVLITALDSPDPEVQLNSAIALGLTGAEAKLAVPKLIQLAIYPSLTQLKAIEALGRVGPDASASIPILIENLASSDWLIRSSSAQALGKIGFAESVPELILATNDDNSIVSQRSAVALAKIGPTAIKDIANTLQAGNAPTKIRKYLAYTLGEIGGSAQIAIPVLVQMIQDEDTSVREAAAFALTQLGLPSINAFTKSLQSSDEQVRNNGVYALTKIAESFQNKFNSDLFLNIGSTGNLEKLQNIGQAIEAFRRTENLMASSNTYYFTREGRYRFSSQSIEVVKKVENILQARRNSIILAIGLQVTLIGIGLTALGAFISLWLRPVMLQQIGQEIFKAQQKRNITSHWLGITQRFLNQAGVKSDRDGDRILKVLSATGRVKSLIPFPVLLLIDKPKPEDILELMQRAENMSKDMKKRSGIILYVESPDTLFRVRMAEVRLRDQFVLIPIPLAAVEKATIDPAACIGLLAQYVDRYLPGADLFDDRNAIGDTLSFFGRTELLHRLEEDLLRGQGVGLFGLRKSGKTSILLQLGFSLRKHPIVHIDLQPYGGKPRYGADLFNLILSQLSALTNNDPRKSIRDDDSMARYNSAIFLPESPATDFTIDFMRHIAELSTKLTQSGYEPPILIFLDEIERILPTSVDSVEKVEEFNAFFGSLRALSQDQGKIGLLVADVHPDCNRINQWAQNGVPTNPVFSFFKEIFLSPFSPEDTQTMLVDISRLMGRSFEQEALVKIHEYSGGHPFISRQLASLLCTKISGQDDEVISYSAALRYIKRPFAYSSILKDYLGQNIWADLKKRNFEIAMTILTLLACNLDRQQGVSEEDIRLHIGGTFNESQCLDALLWLEKVGLIFRIENGDNDCYHSNMPLLSNWIKMELGEEEILKWQI